VARSSRPRRLRRAFFDRPTVVVARALLGTILSVGGPGRRRSVRLVETEAYVARDPANHAYRGRTERNRSMFDRPGTLYVYRIHQVFCANVVTRPGEAVLLRAGAPLGPKRVGASGPGRLCRRLGIHRGDDGTDVARSPRVALFAVSGGPPRIVVGPRVGIRKAVRRRLRFAIAEEPWVSRPALGRRRGPSGASPSRSRGVGRSNRTRTRRRRPSGGGRSGGRTGGR